MSVALPSADRFSDRVENYIKYRPGYPPEVIEYLSTTCALTSDWVVADVGCGPGMSAVQFLENGNRVVGVEPNGMMRSAAREYLAMYPQFSVVDGRADATGLADNSVDLVVAAQAFHWFEPDAAREEFLRIMRPHGWIALIWNERQLDTTPFLAEYESFLEAFARDYQRVRHENIGFEELSAFFAKDYLTAVFPNEQAFDLEALTGRVLSSSYMPTEADAVFPEMQKQLGAIFAKHAGSGKIKVLYDTRLYVAQY